ncbi:hypothetical protein E1301_Tti008899 [Triplophysa tibetana]|uniref:Uncharacterized protein n=1 Tax=Triplophysa tibetana TaxID=1572043 RepID=A0A5A9P2I0_9TELE|nr:hypothetical protein E1301_Tti008899 [Triplophysa tibetana]
MGTADAPDRGSHMISVMWRSDLGPTVRPKHYQGNHMAALRLVDTGSHRQCRSLIRFVLRDLSSFTHSFLQSICGAADLSIIRAGTANPTEKMLNKLLKKQYQGVIRSKRFLHKQ